MDLSRALLDEVILEVFDKEWVQIVDYENIPFRCHKFHEHGHLFRDCPFNKEINKRGINTMKELDSFQKVVNQGKGSKRGPKISSAKDNSSGRTVFRCFKKRKR